LKIYFSLTYFLSHHGPLLINAKDDVYCCLIFRRKTNWRNQIHVRKAEAAEVENGTQQPEAQTERENRGL